ncbi:MAG: carboxyl transferase domain-containing protein [Sphingorhabdus sp.]
MSWPSILAELEQKRAFSQGMGGEARLGKHREAGKLDARARTAALFDDGNYVEIGGLAANRSEATEFPAPADGLIGAFGFIHGRPALAGIEDFTVLAGSIGEAGSAKRYRLAQLALQERVPLVFMLEGAGHRLTNKHGTPSPNDLQALVELSGLVPMVCLVMGASAGHGALTAPLSDFVVMTKAASMFVAGPRLVKAALGEVVSKEDLGGPGVHVVQSGVAHRLAEDDLAAIGLARDWLNYLPANKIAGTDTGPRALDDVLDLVPSDPRIPFDMGQLLEMLFDSGSLFEIQPDHAGSLTVALARLGGQSVAVMANNPSVNAGAIDSAAARKAVRFLRVAQDFGLPVIFLADNPGVLPGTASERAGTLRDAADMFTAQHRLTVPKFHVTIRKAFGFGSSIMAMNPFDGQTLNLAFPAVTLGAMPAQSGGKSAGMDDEARARIAAEQASSALELASRMVYDDVIDPRQLRNILLHGLMLASNRLTRGYSC